jgi:predicted ferric reductase
MSSLSWYAARAAGLVGWALLSASVVWGLLISTRASAFGKRPRPAWTLDLHRYLGGLATVFTAVHVAAVVADSYVHFSLAAVLIPFASQWRRSAVAWGVVAMYLLLAVELTSLARSHLSRRVWRATHVAAFPLWVLGTIHALTAGTDTGTWLFELLSSAAIIVIGGLTAKRIHQSTVEPAPIPVRTARERVAA